MRICQRGVIQSELLQQRRVQLTDGHGLLGHPVTEVIRRSVDVSGKNNGGTKRGQVSFIWRRTLLDFRDGTHETHLSGR